MRRSRVKVGELVTFHFGQRLQVEILSLIVAGQCRLGLGLIDQVPGMEFRLLTGAQPLLGLHKVVQRILGLPQME